MIKTEVLSTKNIAATSNLDDKNPFNNKRKNKIRIRPEKKTKYSMKRILPIIIFLLTTVLYGQNQKQYNHYIADQGLLNPAYNGTRDVISGILVLRNQWMGIDGAPVTQAINVHAPIGLTNLGAGLSIANENIGATHTLDFYGSLAYRIYFHRNQTLSLGLQLGFNSFALDGDKIVSLDNTDQALYSSSNFALNSGVGAYYYTSKMFIGFSIPEFFSNQYDTGTGSYKSTLKFRELHYYLYGGYVFEINDNLAIKPTLLNRVVSGAPWQLDIAGNCLLYKKIWLGLSYKSSKEMVFLTEYIINNKLTVRYSYDYPFSELNQVKNIGSHELGIQFDIIIPKPVLRSIRYF